MISERLLRARLKSIDETVFADGMPPEAAYRFADFCFPVDSIDNEERLAEAAANDLTAANYLYLATECMPWDQTLSNLWEMACLSSIRADPQYQSPLDRLYRELETGEGQGERQKTMRHIRTPHPNSTALTLYKRYRYGVTTRTRVMTIDLIKSFFYEIYDVDCSALKLHLGGASNA